MLVKTSFEDWKDTEGIIESITNALKEFGLNMVQDPSSEGQDGYSFIITDKEGGTIEQSLPNGTPCIFSTKDEAYDEMEFDGLLMKKNGIILKVKNVLLLV